MNDANLELNDVVIEGEIEINFRNENCTLKKRDSFYLPANQMLSITAKSRVIVFVGGALYEGKGKYFTRKFDLQLPVSSGDFVVVPEGYHPTVAIPGVKCCCFWVMAEHNSQIRRYDLAVDDPKFVI